MKCDAQSSGLIIRLKKTLNIKEFFFVHKSWFKKHISRELGMMLNSLLALSS